MNSEDASLVQNITLDSDDIEMSTPRPPPRIRKQHNRRKELIGTANKGFESGQGTSESGSKGHTKPAKKEKEDKEDGNDQSEKHALAKTCKTSEKTGHHHHHHDQPSCSGSFISGFVNSGTSCLSLPSQNCVYDENVADCYPKTSGHGSATSDPTETLLISSGTATCTGAEIGATIKKDFNKSSTTYYCDGLSECKNQHKQVKGEQRNPTVSSVFTNNFSLYGENGSNAYSPHELTLPSQKVKENLKKKQLPYSKATNYTTSRCKPKDFRTVKQQPALQSGHYKLDKIVINSGADTYRADNNSHFKKTIACDIGKNSCTNEQNSIPSETNLFNSQVNGLPSLKATPLPQSNARNRNPITLSSQQLATNSTSDTCMSATDKFYSSLGSQLPKKTVKSVRKIGVFYSDLCDVIRSNCNVMKSNQSLNGANQHRSNTSNIISTNNDNISLVIGNTTLPPENDVCLDRDGNRVTALTVNPNHDISSGCDISVTSNINSSAIHQNDSLFSNPIPSANFSPPQLTNLPDILNSIVPPYHTSVPPPPPPPPPPPYSTLPPPNSTPASRVSGSSRSQPSVSRRISNLLLNSGTGRSPSHHPPSVPPPPPPTSPQLSFSPAITTATSPNFGYHSPTLSSSPPPPHSNAHHHHHHHGLPYLRPGCSRESEAETNTSKSCLTCSGLSIRWFILLISFIGLVCAVIGTFLGAARPTGKEHLTLALLMIGVGIVLITVSGIAWRLTSTGPTWRALFGFSNLPSSNVLASNSLESSRRFLPRVPAPHGRGGAHHHPYGAMFYPEFQYRPPPPSYQASMQEYRLRLLLLERSSSHPQTNSSSPVSPPPTYRSSAASSLTGTLNRCVRITNDSSTRSGNIPSATTTSTTNNSSSLNQNSIAVTTIQTSISRPPSYRSISNIPSNPSIIDTASHNITPTNNNTIGHPLFSSRLDVVNSSNTSQNSLPGHTYKDDVNRVTIHQTTTTSQVCTPNGVNIVAISPLTDHSEPPRVDYNSSVSYSGNNCELAPQTVSAVIGQHTNTNVVEGSEVQILAHV